MLTSPVLERARTADPYFAELRQREFARLDREGLAYLDYAGSALYAESQLRASYDALRGGVFGNPHSESAPSRASTDALDDARALLLAHLDADPDEYVVCFTANTSAAIKLVGESYPFRPRGVFALSADNHNSVNGVREYACRAGARVVHLPLDATLRLSEPVEHLARARANGTGPALFAFPAQSNFTGAHHPLSLVADAQRLGFDVFLDAAAFVPSHALSLRTVSPEFVGLSFYKMFGYPTGIGALVARRDALARLRRPWFAGGTLLFASVQNEMHALRPGAEGFEDGTPHFLAAPALREGLSLLGAVGMQRLSSHVRRLTTLLLRALRALSHRDGTPAVSLYGQPDTDERGGVVAFNLHDRRGVVVPFPQVEERARASGVALRTGCFCNPGAAEAAFRFDATMAARCFDRTMRDPRGFTTDRFASCMTAADPHTPVGAIRASLGMANNDADVHRAVAVVSAFVD